MGWFGRKRDQYSSPARTASMRPHPLRQGTEIAMVGVDPAFIATARTGPKIPRRGHTYPVALLADGAAVRVIADGREVGQLDPRLAAYYIPELTRIQQRGEIGTTVAYVKPENWSNQSHGVALNWSERALVDGGIL